MNYIGSKHRLSSFLKTAIINSVGQDLSNLVFCDLFAGTVIVGRTFKPFVKQVIANDIEFYSYVLNQNYIGNYKTLNSEEQLKTLNNLDGAEGFIFNNYCENGSENRLYFSSENGKKIDAIRQKIEDWKIANKITEGEYYLLLASLIESADKVANTASVYGAYLKQLKKGEIIDQPIYSFITHNRVEDIIKTHPRKVVIVEGILIFNSKRLRDLFDIKIFVHADADEDRRLQRTHLGEERDQVVPED